MSIRSILGRIKRTMQGTDVFTRREIRLETEQHGTSDVGGWVIVRDSVNADSIIYSVGIGVDNSWDLALIAKYGCRIYAFDPSAWSIQWVASQKFDERFIFQPVGLAHFDGEIELRPQNLDGTGSMTILSKSELPLETSGDKIKVARLQTLMATNAHTKIDILKIDIEGAEYEVITDFLECGMRPGQVLLEFHNYVKDGAKKKGKALSELRAAGYKIFSISGTGNEYGLARSKANQKRS